MKTKNHIKSPINDSLRGIGKLGWTEEGKLLSTLKRLSSSFSNEKPIRSKNNKKTVICPECKAELKTNNIGRIPNHHEKYTFFRNNKNSICKGSFSKQKSDKIRTIYLPFTGSRIGKISIGDEILLDFSRAILQEITNQYINLIESKLVKIEKIEHLANNGDVFSSKELLYFNNINTPIPNNMSILQHCIKI